MEDLSRVKAGSSILVVIFWIPLRSLFFSIPTQREHTPISSDRWVSSLVVLASSEMGLCHITMVFSTCAFSKASFMNQFIKGCRIHLAFSQGRWPAWGYRTKEYLQKPPACSQQKQLPEISLTMRILGLADAQKAQLYGRPFGAFSRLYYLNHIPPLAKRNFYTGNFLLLFLGFKEQQPFFFILVYFFPVILLDEKKPYPHSFAQIFMLISFT